MAFREIKQRWAKKYPKGTSERFKNLDAYDKMLEQEFYDILPYPFELEDYNGQIIPVLERRPNVQVSLPKVIVNQTSALLFGEAHAPHVRYWSDPADGDETPAQKATQDAIDKLVYTSEALAVMLEAVRKGATGSCAILLYSLPDDTPWIDVVPGKVCQPVFDPRDPRKLIALHREYPVDAQDLYDLGYDETKYDKKKKYWMRIELDDDAETWYLPLPDEKYQNLGEDDPDSFDRKKISWTKDTERSHSHPFKLVPAIWIRNMGERREIDGPCTFGSIVDIQVALDYTLSMVGRGFRYTADPLLALIEGDMPDMVPAGGMNTLDEEEGGDGGGMTTKVVKSPARALSLPHGGDAKLLEITGKGLAGSLDYAKLLREYAFEVLSGNKADQDHTTNGNAQSGRALEILTQALVWLVEELRVPYGLRGFLPLVRMMLRALVDGAIVVPGVDLGNVDPEMPLRLYWPEWYRPTGQDLMNHMQALVAAAGGSPAHPKQIIPVETAAREAAMVLNVPDPNETVAALLQENPPSDQVQLLQDSLVPPPPPAAPSDKSPGSTKGNSKP